MKMMLYRPAATARMGLWFLHRGPRGPLPPLVLGRLLLDRAIFASRRGVPLKKRNFVCVLSNYTPGSAPPFAPGGSLFSALYACSVVIVFLPITNHRSPALRQAQGKSPITPLLPQHQLDARHKTLPQLQPGAVKFMPTAVSRVSSTK